ncbi:hypothetical protein SKAU_G00084950 [Synaphobranchus kaupii]|uniref:Uncharacterized protein n=1 Tax=Synaphobranchus kaupii TaxID=118154 RepID=A0A9Q1FVW9_SYNKA|nr:hypothetical protein SKAU_G00084950 [Synaphobranchus kaupii]
MPPLSQETMAEHGAEILNPCILAPGLFGQVSAPTPGRCRASAPLSTTRSDLLLRYRLVRSSRYSPVCLPNDEERKPRRETGGGKMMKMRLPLCQMFCPWPDMLNPGPRTPCPAQHEGQRRGRFWIWTQIPATTCPLTGSCSISPPPRSPADGQSEGLSELCSAGRPPADRRAAKIST